MTVESALKPFRVLAYIVGVMLLLLVGGMVLKYGFDTPEPGTIISPIHGFLYVVYLVAALNLGLKARWTWPYTLGVLLAGTVPLLSFVMERKVTQRVQEQIATAQAA
ncbi:DUF3817 domain-containing protein [Sinosporangium siamense]|uniref:DUF3817 domain-containing protein n=1 Tax=Sinosporangium siamense TaxID=1367973 RepID=A0A919V6L5_9ACTN|nr:DUF3817 domain-containing protein [Sinosporangium siamense]GII91127.1 hypothetical protein Ssi02_13580 [Sinosporangium siamense]